MSKLYETVQGYLTLQWLPKEKGYQLFIPHDCQEIDLNCAVEYTSILSVAKKDDKPTCFYFSLAPWAVEMEDRIVIRQLKRRIMKGEESEIRV